MSQLQIDIVTPEASVLSCQGSYALLPSWEGELGVYPEHDQLLVLLRCGLCVVTTDQGQQRFVVGRGFAEVGPERVKILTDSCESADGVDKTTAQAELTAAEAELAGLNLSSETARLALIRQEHALARLSA